jgi:hypothetical protein
LIGTIDDEVTEVATGFRNTVDPSAQQSSTPTSVDVAGGDEETTDEADTETPPAPQQPEKDPDGDGNEKEDGSENLAGDTKAPRLDRPPSANRPRPSGQAAVESRARQKMMVWLPSRMMRSWQCHNSARHSTARSTSAPRRLRVINGVAVIDAHHVLFDDRPLIEGFGHIVRGCANEFDADVDIDTSAHRAPSPPSVRFPDRRYSLWFHHAQLFHHGVDGGLAAVTAQSLHLLEVRPIYWNFGGDHPAARRPSTPRRPVLRRKTPDPRVGPVSCQSPSLVR